MTVLVAGGTGNLGRFIVEGLLRRNHHVRVLVHERPLPDAFSRESRIEAVRGDLAESESLHEACKGVDTIISVAGVLFRPHPERFLQRTNVEYILNLAKAAQRAGARKFILMSFPHVEGETSPDHRATDRLDREPGNAHFRTRLEAERALLALCDGTRMTAIILRAGTVYGRGIKMIEAAKSLMRWRLLAVWPEPTWIHLIALPDLLTAVAAVVENPEASDIYNVADDEPMTIQQALDLLAEHWRHARPRRLSRGILKMGAALIEDVACILGTDAPLTREFLSAGFVSSVADTSRMKRELIRKLEYPSLRDGIKRL